MLRKHLIQHRLIYSSIFCALFLSYWIFRSFFYLPHDFANSYFGAYFFLDGSFTIDIFDPITFNKKIFHEGFRHVFVSYNPNPPSASILFVPFALMNLHESKLIFNCITSAMFGLSLYRICKHIKIDPAVFFALIPIIFFIPIRNQILFGQTYFLLFFLLCEGYLAYHKSNYALSSLLWSIAIFLKIFPVVIFLFLITHKNWKAFFSLSGTSFIILTACVILQGMDVWLYYGYTVLPGNFKGEITSAYETHYQSANVFFKHLFLENTDLNPLPLLNSKMVYHLSINIFKSLILGFCTLFLFLRKDLLGLGVLLLGSILISSFGSTYSNLLLIFILLPLYEKWTGKKWIIIALLIFLTSNFPINIFGKSYVLLEFPRLIFLVGTFASIILFERVKFDWKPFAVFIALFSIPLFALDTPDDPSKLLTKEERHNIMYAYGLKDGFIFYNYWNENGENIFVTSVRGSTLISDGLKIVNEQIYRNGTQITYTKDKKLIPMLLNGDTIIYLSDKDNGIGFYNLRMLKQ